MALNPFLRFERPDNVALWGIDPFAFLSEALKFKPFPAADPTTRDGLRLIFSHVDADGFSNYSAVESGKFSSEVIRDHIYKKYPLPITSSIIEAEVRGYLKRQKPGDEKVLLDIARDIFAMPNILISSHTYSHPFFWMKDDKTTTMYEVQSLELGEAYNLGEISPEREIRGSIEFIRKELAPPGKPVDLILWSGNCRPGPESLRIADEMGLENMNGGDTIISRSRPTLGAVAPLSIPWGDYLQIHAAIQNEMLFTDGFQGPRWGGYQNVIQTFERTELPRRLKPVGIYFHMFMGDRLESLNSLKKVFDWSMAQPLQATSATAFARSVRQTRDAVLFEAGPNRWVAVHGPDQRTFRLPDSGLKPDLSKSQNLIGYNTANGQIYLSSGRGLRTEIMLDENPSPHIYLESSTAEVEVTEFKPQGIALHAKDFRPVTVVLAGLSPNSPCTVTANGVEQNLETDGTGRLTVTGGESLDLKINGAPIP
jgi:hypothetical protein